MLHLDRRSVLGGAVGAVAAGLAARTVGIASASPAVTDVIVVGGGLSGLATAKALRAAGRSVVVLEARNRAGGRVQNIKTPGGRTVDGGAEFLGPTQDRIAAYAAEFGVQTLPTYNDGDNIFWRRNSALRYPALIPAPPIPDAVTLAPALAEIDLTCVGFPVGEPWRHPDAGYLDSITWQDWIDRHAPTEDAKLLLALAETAALSVRPHELSALYMMNYFAAAGNEQSPGSFERLLSTSGGAQERFFNGGAALVPLRLAESMKGSMVYEAPVRSIRQEANGTLTVSSDRGRFTARKVVVAMSPAISSRIDYQPGLPPDRIALCQGYKMGRLAKFVAAYDRAFWRDQGFSGQTIGDGQPIDVTFESYGEGNHFLMGFIGADAMSALDNVPDDVFVERCLDSLVNYFGPEARTGMIDHGFKKWDNDPYSWGAPVAVSAPGVLTRFGPALRQPVGGIHWAGTETSDFWTGYMDGAIRSGERAAKEVLATLPH